MAAPFTAPDCRGGGNSIESATTLDCGGRSRFWYRWPTVNVGAFSFVGESGGGKSAVSGTTEKTFLVERDDFVICFEVGFAPLDEDM